jgi:hypothetical protein
MIDIKIQEVFDYFYSPEIRWRDAIWRGTTLKGIQYYYAEEGRYIFRISYGYLYAFISIQANSIDRAIRAIADNEHNMGKLKGVCDE